MVKKTTPTKLSIRGSKIIEKDQVYEDEEEMPSKRFNQWVKYFQCMTAADPQPSGGANEIPLLPMLAQMAIESKPIISKCEFLNKLAEAKTEELKVEIMLTDQDIRKFINMVVDDMMEGQGVMVKKTQHKTQVAMNAALKCVDENRLDDALIWLNKAIHAAPNDKVAAECYIQRAQVFLRMQRLQDTLLDLTDAMRVGSDMKREDKIGLLVIMKDTMDATDNEASADQLENLISTMKKQKTKHENEKIVKLLESLDINEVPGSVEIVKDDSTNFVSNHQLLEGATTAIELRYEDGKGRSMFAAQDIQPGQVVIKESSYTHHLDFKHLALFCSHCLKKHNGRFVPCEACETITYCSYECQRQAWKQYHRIECGYHEALRFCSPSYDAMRVMMIEGIDEVLSAEKTDIPMKDWLKRKFKSNLESFMSLMGHDMGYSPIVEFSHMFGSVIAIMVCVRLGIIKEDDPRFGSFCGAFIRLIKRTRTNSWAIYAGISPPIVRCGSGIYATLSLINHSCTPNLTQLYYGRLMVVKAKRAIKQGEELTMSYGPISGQKPVSERRAHLKRCYNFECDCEACLLEFESIRLYYTNPPTNMPRPSTMPGNNQINASYQQQQQQKILPGQKMMTPPPMYGTGNQILPPNGMQSMPMYGQQLMPMYGQQPMMLNGQPMPPMMTGSAMPSMGQFSPLYQNYPTYGNQPQMTQIHPKLIHSTSSPTPPN